MALWQLKCRISLNQVIKQLLLLENVAMEIM